ncbi:MAG: hypothetical protein HY722_01610, partial [Planctomycetes bacterium]|nr:hypothetical protein [Planctomycetota bacterium]
MATEQEVLFGRLAVRLGLCTELQVQEAIQVQARSPIPRPLGSILVELGHLTKEQRTEVADAQVERLELPPENARERKEDLVLGKLIVKQGLLPRKAVARALRVQIRMENEGRLVRLAQILLDEGALDRGQLAEVLEFQRTHVLTCPRCLAQFNLVGFQEGKRFKCRQCEAVLTVPIKIHALEDPRGVAASERRPAAGR